MTELNSFNELNISHVRSGKRAVDELRPVHIALDYIPSADGSVLIECGNTRVICVASVEDRLPRWMMQEPQKTGWITAEYSLMPYAGGGRRMRESTQGKVGGRTHEIQRLIGRSLRSAVNLKQLGDRTIWIDCDVIQADGGTRTASITGGFIALYAAVHRLVKRKVLRKLPVLRNVSAISVGIVHGQALLDLDYSEDFAAAVDFNVVMTDKGEYIETQGTAEEQPYSRAQLDAMLALAEKGCRELYVLQNSIIAQLT
jgi:ribonuclease PH